MNTLLDDEGCRGRPGTDGSARRQSGRRRAPLFVRCPATRRLGRAQRVHRKQRDGRRRRTVRLRRRRLRVRRLVRPNRPRDEPRGCELYRRERRGRVRRLHRQRERRGRRRLRRRVRVLIPERSRFRIRSGRGRRTNGRDGGRAIESPNTRRTRTSTACSAPARTAGSRVVCTPTVTSSPRRPFRTIKRPTMTASSSNSDPSRDPTASTSNSQ